MHTPRPTPTPMPAFAPVERPEAVVAVLVLAGVVLSVIDAAVDVGPVEEAVELALAETLDAAAFVDADGVWPGSICIIVVGRSL